jgi:hypothetical protein
MIETRDAQDLASGLSRMASSLDRLGMPTSATVTIDAGGTGVWAATAACLIMVAVMFASGFWVTWAFGQMQAQIDVLRAKSETQEAYLQAIYQIAPQLQPKESEQ